MCWCRRRQKPSRVSAPARPFALYAVAGRRNCSDRAGGGGSSGGGKPSLEAGLGPAKNPALKESPRTEVGVDDERLSSSQRRIRSRR